MNDEEILKVVKALIAKDYVEIMKKKSSKCL